MPQDMHIPEELGLTDQDVNLLQTSQMHPPVTIKTLQELDLMSIMSNVNLRVDINYDHDLHFMPVKGKRGDQKRKEAQWYWAALALELQIYSFTARQPGPIAEQQLKMFEQRLPHLVADLKALLLTLIPDVEAESINQTLDVPLLMQQVENGVLNIAKLATWLGNLLKSHCAPMRDAWADDMVRRIELGLAMDDATCIVAGLEKLFSILEAMKLDVANHQIRSFRLYLIEDTVNFQSAYFHKKIAEQRFDPSTTRKWHEEAQQQHYTCNESTSQNDGTLRFASLIHGLTAELTTAGGMARLPPAFQCDRGRLQQLRTDVQNLIHLDLCCSLLRSLLTGHGAGSTDVSPTEMLTNFASRLFSLLWDDVRITEQAEEVWQNNTDVIALELARAVYESQNRDTKDISHAEVARIEQCLSNVLHGQYSQHQRTVNKIHEQVERSTMFHAQTFDTMSPFAMAESQKKWRISRDKLPGTKLPDPEDISRRLAHIATMNWRVFRDLIYKPDEHLAAPHRQESTLSLRSIPAQRANPISSAGRIEEQDLSSGSTARPAEQNQIG
ncbi:putative camp-mediated signaling protein [Phaeomoniella chlamydospora]|uniref:Putative camp-mediated signaling protein n=1 Tax=Phaeomoniella chlamydospora TaxID=158046 RepID=A0A0G2EMA1_PHACM|nr:putative camp-mediated signaling protein [Phaeomoniella chlamydospora]